jgi:hypothetical protein
VITQETLELRLGFKLTDLQWAFLEESPLLRAAEQGHKTFDEFVAEVRELFCPQSPRQREPGVSRREELGPVREQVVSVLLALQAAAHADVKAFRDQDLAGDLVPLDELGSWMREHAEDRALSIEVDVPDDTELTPDASGWTVKPPLSVRRIDPPATFHRRSLSYVDAAGEVRLVTTSRDGVLAQVKELALKLSTGFGWTEAQAVTFVLTDAVPLLQEVRVRVQVRSTPAASRIILEIDPTVRKERVAAIYQRHRAALGGLGRSKGIGEKNLTLARFAAEREGLNWRSKFDKWNAEYPHWRYSHLSNFNRDALVAERRLLGTERQRKEKG